MIPFEISEPQRAFIERRFADNPRVAPCRTNIFDCKDWNSFDCIFSANVLEHIEDDQVVLGHCAALLKPGAWCVALVPAHRWLYSAFDKQIGHFRRYNASDLLRLGCIDAHGASLQLRDSRHVNIPGALGWFLSMRLLGRTSIGRNDAATVGRLLPLIRAFDRLRLPIGLSQVLAWQRRV